MNNIYSGFRACPRPRSSVVLLLEYITYHEAFMRVL